MDSDGRRPGPPGADEAAPDPPVLRITPSVSIPLAEVQWRADPSGGPGGQHANRTASRVEVSFDVAASTALDAGQRARLLDRLGPVVRAAAGDSRSQAANRARALDRLRSKLAAALAVTPPRRPTAPGAAARQRRLDEKRRRSALKRQRRSAGDAD